MADHRSLFIYPLLVSTALLGACSDDEGPADSGVAQPDATPEDAGVSEPDAGSPADTGTAEPDAGTPDSGVVTVDIRIPDLSAPVEIRFDQNGMLHIKCETNLDCFAAEGYFHASHRFGQMDTRRRFARGRLSELFGFAGGDTVLNIDRQFRRFLATREGGRLEDVLWENSTPETKAMFQAYTRGVNAWIEDLRNNRNRAQRSLEWRTVPVSAITDWDVLDSVACALPLMEDLTNNSGREINGGEVFARMAPEKAADLYGVRPVSPSTILPIGITGLSTREAAWWAPWAQDISLRMMHASDVLREANTALDVLGVHEYGRGSNNWVVAPDQTDGNYALLANDPHLGFDNPVIWYLLHMDSTQGSGNLHVSGVSFAGLPGIIIGQNADLAWGMTTTFFDMTDVYLEELSPDGNGVMFNGQVVPFVESSQTFERNGLAPVTDTFLYVPHHGPVVAMDLDAGTAVTIRWVGQETDTDLNFFNDVMYAETVDEARVAAENITSIGQNLVFADKEGSIAWLPYSRLPTRPWASALMPPWLPLPGDGSAEWGPPVPYADLPQSINPPQGWLATANGDMSGALQDGDPTNDGNRWHQTYAAIGYRQERIVGLIEAQNGQHTTETMRTIQDDVHSLLAERNLPRILAAAETRRASLSATAQAMLDALGAWQYQCPTGLTGVAPDSPADTRAEVTRESAGCTAFHVVWEHLEEAVFRDDFDEVGLGISPRGHALIVALTQPNTQVGGDVYWDNVSTSQVETSTDTMTAAVEAAAGWLSTNLGDSADDWRWGRIHTVTLSAALSELVAGDLNNGPYADEGGLYTVTPAHPRNLNNYTFGSGSSMRYVCEVPSTGPRCTNQLPGGQRHFQESPYYDDLLQEWLVNQSRDMPFDETDVAQAAVETLTVRAP